MARTRPSARFASPPRAQLSQARSVGVLAPYQMVNYTCLLPASPFGNIPQSFTLSAPPTQCTERCPIRLGGRRRLRRNAPSPCRQIGCYRVVRRTARLVAPSRSGIRRTAVEWQLADAERLDRRAGPGGQRAPARRLQVLRAVPYHPLSNPPLPHRARPRAAGDDCLLLTHQPRTADTKGETAGTVK